MTVLAAVSSGLSLLLSSWLTNSVPTCPSSGTPTIAAILDVVSTKAAILDNISTLGAILDVVSTKAAILDVISTLGAILATIPDSNITNYCSDIVGNMYQMTLVVC